MTQTGVYVGNDPAAFAAYAQWVGSTPGNVLNYLNNDSWSAFDSSIGYEVSLWKSTAAPSIWSVPLTVWGTSLEQVATGAYNDHFLQAAQGLAQTKPSGDGFIYVRVGWEFNGSWMPWAANGHEAAFVQSFQNLVDTFRSVSDKFKFVWDTTNDGGNMNPEKAYPGDKYVDVVGTDVYYHKQWDGADAVKAFQGDVTRAYGLQWQQDFARAHGKQTAISEWGVASDNAAPYVQAMTKWIADHGMVYENYWDSNADYSGKLSTGANATAGAAYKTAIATLQGATAAPAPAPELDPVAITSSGGLTNTLAVKLAGTVGASDAGAVVHLLDGTTEIGTATVQADGQWSAALTLTNQQGVHQIAASSSNTAGTAKSDAVSYTVDTVAPTLTVSESVAGITNKTSNVITVTSSDDLSGVSTVRIADNGVDLGAATRNADGNWVFTATKLADGAHNFTAVAVDNAGNASGSVSAGSSMVVDTLAPVVKIGLSQDTGQSNTDKITTDAALTGLAEAGTQVTLTEGATTLGTVTADSTGHWSFAPTGLKIGAHTIQASQTDAAGNTGSDTLVFNLQASAPAPTIVTQTVANGYDVVTTEANRVVTDSFDFNWQRTGAEIVTKETAGKTIDQHFDKDWQQTSAQITETTADGNRVVKQFYDGNWNMKYAEIENHNIVGQSYGSTRETFDASWHEIGWTGFSGKHLDDLAMG